MRGDEYSLGLTSRTASRHYEAVKQGIRWGSPIDFKFKPFSPARSIGGSTSRNQRGNSATVKLNKKFKGMTKGLLPQGLLPDEPVSDENFFRGLTTLHHEARHVEQYAMFEGLLPATGEAYWRDVAVSMVAAHGNPAYYRANHDVMLHEIDADFAAVARTYAYLRDNFPDSERACGKYLDYVNEHICGRHGLTYEGRERLDSFEDVGMAFKRVVSDVRSGRDGVLALRHKARMYDNWKLDDISSALELSRGPLSAESGARDAFLDKNRQGIKATAEMMACVEMRLQGHDLRAQYPILKGHDLLPQQAFGCGFEERGADMRSRVNAAKRSQWLDAVKFSLGKGGGQQGYEDACRDAGFPDAQQSGAGLEF